MNKVIVMEKKESDIKVEVKPNGGLMRKTKLQLVEIILRKDNLHKELNENIKTIEVENKALWEKFETLETKNSILISDRNHYKECFNNVSNSLDAYVDLYNKSIKRNKRLNIINLILIILCLISISLWIIW